MNLNNSDISVYGQGSTPGIQFGKYLQYGALPKIFEWTNNKFHDNLGYYLVSGWEPFQVNHTNSEFYNLNTAMLTGGTYRNCTFRDLDTQGSWGHVLLNWGGGGVYDSEFYNINGGGGLFCCKEGDGGAVFQNNHIHTEIVDLVAGTRKVIDVVFITNSGGDITSPIISANSPAGAGVEVNTPITVTFSEIMNKTSVENAFSLSPMVSGSFTWPGSQLIFTPAVNLADSTTYMVEISTDAQDSAGNNLAALYTWSFTTGVLSPDLPEVKDKKNVLVYPNPYIKGEASSNKITFLNLGKEAIIKIYNTGGELIKELSTTSDSKAEWEVSDVNSGVYLYVITSLEGTKKGKVSVIK